MLAKKATVPMNDILAQEIGAAVWANLVSRKGFMNRVPDVGQFVMWK
jgi:hypothetical protein